MLHCSILDSNAVDIRLLQHVIIIIINSPLDVATCSTDNEWVNNNNNNYKLQQNVAMDNKWGLIN